LLLVTLVKAPRFVTDIPGVDLASPLEETEEIQGELARLGIAIP
jgi:hypothetical protein